MPKLDERRCSMIERIDPDVRSRLDDALARRDAREIEDLLRDLRPESLESLFRTLGDEYAADVVAELDPAVAADLLLRLSSPAAADVLQELPPDEATDVVGELSAANRDLVLAEMEPEEAEDVRELLAYEPDTAGGRMTNQFHAIRESQTAGEALEQLRREGEEQGEIVSYVYVTDLQEHLVGVVRLHDLVTSPLDRRIGEITRREVVRLRTTDDQESAARLLRDRGLLALPVVDQADRLVGIVTADDMATVLEEEASEDIERLGGSQPLEEPYLSASIWHLFRKRIVWLLVLFVASAYTGNVLQAYEDELIRVVALTFFIPLLIGTGGNTGSQTVSMLVRAMALGEVRLRDIGRVVAREMTVALLLGATVAAATYGRAWTLGVGQELGLVVALTAVAVVLWAALVAAVLPLVLQRLRIDPAVASAPF
ncbi:MAG: magnesium transporter, partial [Chloroflexi bacterium]|nr:magnesium transporter [Chloroflexota bacterium]